MIPLHEMTTRVLIKASPESIKEAKELLRREGYVVIPKDRHVVLNVSNDIAMEVLEHMRDSEQAKSFIEHCDRMAAPQFGHELMEKGLILKHEEGYDWKQHRYGFRYSMAVIKPRADEDKR